MGASRRAGAAPKVSMGRAPNSTQVGHNQTFTGVAASPKAGKTRMRQTRRTHTGRRI